MMMKAQLTPGWNALDERLYRWVGVFARLRPGITAGQAQAGAVAVLHVADRGRPEGSRVRAGGARDAAALCGEHAPGDSFLAGPIRAPPDADHAALGADGHRRRRAPDCLRQRREPAPRARRGAAARDRRAAGARRDARAHRGQLLVESLLLALAGGAAGVAIAAIGAPAVLGFFVSPDAPAPISTSPDWRILAFTFAISTLTGVLFGMAPAHSVDPPGRRADAQGSGRQRARRACGGCARDSSPRRSPSHCCSSSAPRSSPGRSATCSPSTSASTRLV